MKSDDINSAHPSDKTDNELIAEFMGLPLTKEEYLFSGGTKTVPFRKWQYHDSWDWLMPVVSRINQLWMGCGGAGELGQMCDQVTLMHVSDKIERVYGAVVFFIKWYNANQPKP